jgi:hypothetical protein
MQEAQMAIPDRPIAVMAEINGKRVQIGTGHINPETLIFTTKLDDDSPYTEILLARAKERGDYSGWVNVSQVELAYLGDIPMPVVKKPESNVTQVLEAIEVSPTGHAMIKDIGELDINEPLPKFHDHD